MHVFIFIYEHMLVSIYIYIYMIDRCIYYVFVFVYRYVRYVRMSSVSNQTFKRQMSNAGDGGGALWPGAKCQGLSLRQSSHDKRSSEVRRFGLTGLNRFFWFLYLKGGNQW